MALPSVLRHVRGLVAAKLSDRQFLQRFAVGRDEVASAANPTVTGSGLASALLLPRFLKLTAALALTLGVAAAAAGSLSSPSPQTQPLPPALAKGVEPPKSSEEKQARADFYGDPLPPGALARLGTVRLRVMCATVAFSADGTTLIGVDDGHLVCVWDADRGDLRETRLLPGRPGQSRSAIRSARSPDGKTLLIDEGVSLAMWDIPSGRRLEVSLPKARKGLDRFALSDDRRLLLLVETSEEQVNQNGRFGGFGPIQREQKQNLLLWDTATKTERLLANDDSGLVALAIAPDGKLVASSSYGRGTRVWDAATGKLRWQEPRFNAEKVAFTPDGRRLIAAPGGGQGTWHVWDSATGKPSPHDHPPTVGYVWTFTVSPDGDTLLIPTATDYVLWDLKTGTVRHRWPGANQAGQGVFAPDGRATVTYDTILRRWDLATGKPLYADVSPLGHTAPVRHLFFTPDGTRLASIGEDGRLRVWDVASAKQVHSLHLREANLTAWALSPDGASLVGVDEHLTVHQWSLAEGRPGKGYQLDEANGLAIGLRALQLRITPDGNTLAVLAWPRSPEYRYRQYSFSFWDLETGRLQRWGGDPGQVFQGESATLSPDGRFAAGGDALFDTQASASRYPLVMPENVGGGGMPLFSPDGRLLAAAGKGVRVWETATGRPLIDLPEASTYRAAFSPDGRRFAFAGRRHLEVWDLLTETVVLKRAAPEHRDRYDQWASGDFRFSPNGRAIATGHTDGTILLWVVPPVASAAARLTEREEAGLWADLADENPARGYAAVWRWCQEPEGAVRSLPKRLHPVPRPADGELRALIRTLDSDQFQEREAAARSLAVLGRAAEPALRQALKDQPTLEQRRRIETLLGALPTRYSRPQGDNLRALRAVAILEGINTVAARQALEEWAMGSAAAWLTQEAKASLDRLNQRKRSGP
jgi:WD40 repeat protein